MVMNKEYNNVSQQLVNYDFGDVSDGAGYTTTYGSTYQNNESLSGSFLTRNVFWCPIVNQAAVGTTSPIQKEADRDFDIMYNIPRIIQGKVYISFYSNLTQNGTNGTNTAYFVARVRKWDPVNSVETEIASQQSQTLTISSTTAVVTRHLLGIDVPLTSFKVGESFRLTIETWIEKTGASIPNLNYFFDPQNQGVTATVLTTILKVFIPSIIDT